jgi:putative DNA-invertase from lambdoid prophage Rac
MKVALYVRVSTDKQTHESQLLELREYCARHKFTNVTEYSDTISGSKFTRVGLDALMQEVRKGKLDLILCYKLDRLGRSLAHLAQICSELESNKVALICTSQGIDTSNSNPAGRLQLNVLMAVAEFERSIIQERVIAGLNAARARGVKLGRKDKSSKHKMQVMALVANGVKTREIARALQLSVGSAHRLVTKVKGEMEAEIKPKVCAESL